MSELKIILDLSDQAREALDKLIEAVDDLSTSQICADRSFKDYIEAKKKKQVPAQATTAKKAEAPAEQKAEAVEFLKYLKQKGTQNRIESPEIAGTLESVTSDTPAAAEPKQAVPIETVATSEPTAVIEVPTLQTVRSACKDFIAQKGSETFKAILAQFNASRLSDVAPNDFQKLMETLNAN